MKLLLEGYGKLLDDVDVWFKRCADSYPGIISCSKGCSACCRGLFDITLLDGFYLKSGFDLLHESLKIELTNSASKRMAGLSQLNPAFVNPWLLNSIPEDDWEALMPEEDETPCLLLSETGECLVYNHRPMTCRLNGIPLIDISGEEFFDEWCTLNFVDEDPRSMNDLRFGFTELFTRELSLFQEFMNLLTGRIKNEVDLFIPAAILMDREKIVSALKKWN